MIRIRVAVALAVTLVPGSLMAQGATTSDATGHWAAIEQCARIDATEERHGCMDDVIRRAGLLNDARLAETARREFGNENRPPENRVTAPPAPASPAASGALGGAAAAPPVAPPAPQPAAAPAAPARAADLDQLATTVTAARLGPDRRLVVVTAEGSSWTQVQSETFRTLPRAGDRFTIERSSLGSFRCRAGNSSVFRCRRVD
jgi:hypothetical protein